MALLWGWERPTYHLTWSGTSERSWEGPPATCLARSSAASLPAVPLWAGIQWTMTPPRPAPRRAHTLAAPLAHRWPGPSSSDEMRWIAAWESREAECCQKARVCENAKQNWQTRMLYKNQHCHKGAVHGNAITSQMPSCGNPAESKCCK